MIDAELKELISKLRVNIKDNIPNATINEENYYLRGMIDTVLLFSKYEQEKTQ